MATSDIHRRVRLEAFELEELPDGRFNGRVVLAWSPGETFVGRAEGEATPQGQLRCAAEATARALERASGDKVALEVLAVKAIEGFNTVIVVVSLSSQVEDLVRRLVGSCLTDDDPGRGAALAVLDATNRLLGRVLHGTDQAWVPA